MMKLKSGSRRE